LAPLSCSFRTPIIRSSLNLLRFMSFLRSGSKGRKLQLGRPPMPLALVRESEMLARTTTLSVRAIHRQIDGRASRGRVGEITKRVRSAPAGPCDQILHVS